MEPSNYRYFLAVLDTGSVRRAAEQTHISPSAISRHIQLLEHTFGATLFERRASGMVATEEGRIVAQFMRGTVRDMDLARAQIDELHGLVRGTVSLAAIEGVFRSWLLPAIAEFQKEHEGIAFDCRVAAADLVVEAVRADSADIGVTLEPLDSDLSFDVRHRFETRFVAAWAVGHPLSAKRVVRLKDLVHFPLAMLNSRFHTRQWLDQALIRERLDAHISFQLDHIEHLKRLVRDGQHVTVLPDYAVAAEAAEGLLDVRDIPGAEAVRRTVLFVRQGRVLPRAVQAFLQQVRNRAPA